MKRSDYVELRCKSAFSFLEGASNPEDLIQRAAALDYDTLALGDRDGLYGAPRFHQAAKTAGLRGIVGAELTLVDAGQHAKPLLALVENQAGYRGLSRLITRGRMRAPKGFSRIGWDELEEHADGLVLLMHGDASLDETELDRALGIAGPGRLWVDVSRHREREAQRAARRAVAIAEARGVPLVATNAVHHARPEDRRVQDVFTCLRWKTTLQGAGRLLLPNAERHLRSPAEMEALFADHPQWLRASREIAEHCSFTLENLGYRFPLFPTRDGETQQAALRRETYAGARQRYGTPLSKRVRRQLEHELEIIAKLDLAGYFLIVHDIVGFAKRQGMLVQGRGSAANSAVCYALGITAVDPVGMELLFERFLSEERGEWPDIDLDLPSGEQRESVIQHVFERYGALGAAMTANVITYRTKSAVREVGKVLSMAPEQIDRLSRALRGIEDPGDPKDVRAAFEEFDLDPSAPPTSTALELVDCLQRLPRHLGQHSGGIVIAAGRLDEVVPIEPASMADRRVVQWDKDDCAQLGIIKIDLLGLGMLKALEETLPLIQKHEGIAIDLAKLPADDPKTYAMVQRADTIGVFQIESRAQMAVLPRLKPRCFYDLVVQVAIIRPGPIVGGMVNPYLDRHAGLEPVAYPHPSLEPILKRTLGIPLFQEQLLRMAMVAADFSGGEAEELRRAMGFKRSTERMAEIEARLRSGMNAKGIRGKAQEEILRGITSFALYGFPESHAASFALIAYASAYLKAHHPAAFVAGLLNAAPLGFYSGATLVKDLQRHGVEVRPIDIAYSCYKTTLERTLERTLKGPCQTRRGTRQPCVRLGLRHVHGLRAETGLAIKDARAQAPFQSLADLTKRVAFRDQELETLAELGALASIDPAARKRRAALWQIAALTKDPDSLFAGIDPKAENYADSPFPEMCALETTLADYQASGMTTGPHLMQHLRPTLQRRGILSAAELVRRPHDAVVHTAGHVIVRQRPYTAKGFCFLTLEDETGTSNAVLTPKNFRRFRSLLHTSALMELKGRIQNVRGVVHLFVLYATPLDLEAAAESESKRPLPPSHDYR